jgi:hypothetical protein
MSLEIEALMTEHKSSFRKLVFNRLQDCVLFIHSISDRPTAPYIPTALGHLNILVTMMKEGRVSSNVIHQVFLYCWTSLFDWIEAHPDHDTYKQKLDKLMTDWTKALQVTTA